MSEETDEIELEVEQALFAETLEFSDPLHRAAFLEKACAGDPSLRSRIQSLLEPLQERLHRLDHDRRLIRAGHSMNGRRRSHSDRRAHYELAQSRRQPCHSPADLRV